MNCLLCNYKSPDVYNLKKHYTSYHRINPANFFFLQLFNQENKLVCKECLRCHEFLITKAFMDKHNFLKHYSDGEKKPAEYKTIDIIKKRQQYIKYLLKNIRMNTTFLMPKKWLMIFFLMLRICLSLL